MEITKILKYTGGTPSFRVLTEDYILGPEVQGEVNGVTVFQISLRKGNYKIIRNHQRNRVIYALQKLSHLHTGVVYSAELKECINFVDVVILKN